MPVIRGVRAARPQQPGHHGPRRSPSHVLTKREDDPLRDERHEPDERDEPGKRRERARGVSFTRAELKSFTGATLPDLIADGVRLLFVGINPGLRSVAVQGHFAPRGNRFYPALLRAGITDHLIDASAGLTARDRDYLLGRGVGITSLVTRATASAAELGSAELAEGARNLAGKVRRFRPRVVAILGVTAYRTAFAAPRAVLGRQPDEPGQLDLNGAQVWVVPNPSGRNAHAPLDTLAAAYREVALAAGVGVTGPAAP
jgi:double-stranded uracil-DNA glycosylase